jgi:preprotein translocase subunit SecD
VRRRGLRVFALIFVVVALGIASLSFREVHISVPGFFDIDRDASGPLGLSLGLDLEGGSDLRYQADLPDQVALEFEEAVDEADLVDLLQELGQTKAAIAKPEFVLNDLSLRQLSETALSQRLEAEVALIGSIEFQDDGLEVAFLSTADEGTISLTLAQLGYQDAVLETIGENQFSVRGLAFLETAENQIKEAMGERLGPLGPRDG